MILGVSRRTSNEVVAGELGWWDLKSRREKIMLKYWKTLVGMGEREIAGSLLEGGCWEEEMEVMLERKGWGVSVDFGTPEVWRTLVTSLTRQEVEGRWRRGIELKPKLRTYARLKTKLEYEPYLDWEDRWARRYTARMRGGTNKLRIETGRWKGEEVEERKCRICGVVEDEEHFVAQCDLGELVREELRLVVGEELEGKSLWSGDWEGLRGGERCWRSGVEK